MTLKDDDSVLSYNINTTKDEIISITNKLNHKLTYQ